MAESDRDKAIRLAKKLYEEKKAEGVDFSNGPCISEGVVSDGWGAVAHEPRHALDNLPQNQCRSYRTGRVHHFIELDPDGNVIRAV